MRYTVLNGLIAASLAAAIASCGGGAESGGTTASGGTGGTGISAGTITAYGSVVVNGVHFDETGAAVVINDTPGSGEHQGLKIGMTVKIKVTSFNDDNGPATASDIEAEHEVEGVVESIDVPNKSFTVLGQTIYIDKLLHSINLGGSVVPTTKVEVYGLRDGDGAIHATLIELNPDDFEPEVRGTVANLDPAARTFAIGGLVIHYDDMTDFDHGDAGNLVEGTTVEVEIDTSNPQYAYATKIEFEENEDSEFRAGDGDRQEVEGFIADYNAGAGTFTVDGVPVQMTSTTVLTPSNAVLSNGIPITARGTTSSGVVIASEIELH